MAVYSIEVFADYHQFYLWDSAITDSAWDHGFTDDDCYRLVITAPGLVVVQPVRNETVPVEVALLQADPGYDPNLWDHVAECALDVPSGRLQVQECTGETVLDVAMDPGCYRVRLLFSGLGTISDDGLDSADLYRIDLWPGDHTSLHIVKQRVNAIAG